MPHLLRLQFPSLALALLHKKEKLDKLSTHPHPINIRQKERSLKPMKTKRKKKRRKR